MEITRTRVELTEKIYKNLKKESIQNNLPMNKFIITLIQEDLLQDRLDEAIDLTNADEGELHDLTLRIPREMYIQVKKKIAEKEISFKKYIQYLVLKNLKNKLLKNF